MPPPGKSASDVLTWGELDGWILEWEARMFRRFEGLEARLEDVEAAPAKKRGSQLVEKARGRMSTGQWPTRMSQEIELASRQSPGELETVGEGPASILRASAKEVQRQHSVNLEDALMAAMDGDDGELPEFGNHFIAEVAIQPTVWEAALVLGVPTVGFFGSLSIAFALCMNIFFQVTFCLIIWTHFLEAQFPDPENLRHWRIAVGHDWEHVDKTFGTSMVTRVCMKDDSIAISNAQRTVLDHVDAYLQPVRLASFMTTGSVMVCLAIAVWTLIVLKEVWRAFHFLQAVVFVPRGKTDFEEVLVDGARHSIVIVSISHGRFFFQVFVTTMRLCVAVTLMGIGSQWLALTTEINEVFLNAVSIAFVLDIDELVFENFIPLPTKVLLGTFRALPRRAVLRYGMDAPPVFNFVVCLAVVLLLFACEVSQLKAQMEEARAILCEGNRLFAVSMQSATGVILATRTEDFNRTSRSGVYLMAAVGELNQTSPGAELSATKVLFQPDRSLFTASVHESYPEMMEHVIHCSDMDFVHDPDGLGPYLHALRHQLGRTEATGCGELRDACSGRSAGLLRFACPVTCGCDAPYSGLFLNGPSYGCPQEVCHESRSYRSVLEAMACEDVPPAVLADASTPEGAGWTAVRTQFRGWLEAMVSQDGQDPETLEQLHAITYNISTYGCGAMGSDLVWSLFCIEHRHSYTSLIAYCPAACGCRESFQHGCPTDCRSDPAS